MSPRTCVLLLFLLTLTLTSALRENPPTVYEALEAYGFPVGLLPVGVLNYTLNPTSGAFVVYLNKTCSFKIQGYDLKYKTRITGTISTDKIEDLTGIQVKILLFWINIVEVDRDHDDLELSVGIASAEFPYSSFVESPQCGCGFDCNNIDTSRGLRRCGGFKRLVSSS